MEAGLTYLRPTLGYLLVVVLLIPYLDRIYNRLVDASENGRESQMFRKLLYGWASVPPGSRIWL